MTVSDINGVNWYINEYMSAHCDWNLSNNKKRTHI